MKLLCCRYPFNNLVDSTYVIRPPINVHGYGGIQPRKPIISNLRLPAKPFFASDSDEDKSLNNIESLDFLNTISQDFPGTRVSTSSSSTLFLTGALDRVQWTQQVIPRPLSTRKRERDFPLPIKKIGGTILSIFLMEPINARGFIDTIIEHLFNGKFLLKTLTSSIPSTS